MTKDLISNFPGEINWPFYVMTFGEGQQPALCSPLHNIVYAPKHRTKTFFLLQYCIVFQFNLIGFDIKCIGIKNNNKICLFLQKYSVYNNSKPKR